MYFLNGTTELIDVLAGGLLSIGCSLLADVGI
jgi:hypothetical protein